MPAVTTTGYISKTTPGFEFLGNNSHSKIGLHFSGSTLPITLRIGIWQDGVVGTFTPLTDELAAVIAITSLPTSLVLNAVNDSGLVIDVSGGSPDFVVTYLGPAGPLR